MPGNGSSSAGGAGSKAKGIGRGAAPVGGGAVGAAGGNEVAPEVGRTAAKAVESTAPGIGLPIESAVASIVLAACILGGAYIAYQAVSE